MGSINQISGRKRHYPLEEEGEKEKSEGESRMLYEDILVSISQSCKLLPAYLFVEILSRLPVKSLMRFKCVCKSLSRLILSPLFMNMHRNHSKNKAGLLIDYYDCAASDRFIQTSSNSVFLNRLKFKDVMDMNIAGCSNGLVCFCCPYRQNYVLLNPATREIIYLPARKITLRETPRFITFQTGFAFIPSINDYKLVLHCFYDHELSVIELFTWSTNSWKTIEAILPCEINYFADHNFVERCVVNEAMHWLGVGLEGCKYVVYFDIVKEKFGKFILPGSSEYNIRMHSKTLAVLKQSLAMFAFQKTSNPEFDVWILNAYGGTEMLWTRLYTAGTLTGCFRPSGFWMNDEIIFSKYVMGNFDPVLYHPQTTEIKDLPLEPLYINSFMAYIESLFPVKRSCEFFKQERV